MIKGQGRSWKVMDILLDISIREFLIKKLDKSSEGSFIIKLCIATERSNQKTLQVGNKQTVPFYQVLLVH